jgi:tRNA(Ile)-lysidine synthase
MSAGVRASDTTVDVVDPLARWRPVFDTAVRDVAAPVVVACSGGADSVALLALAADARLDPVAVHVDHGLRVGSEREAEDVRATAARLGVRFLACSVTLASGTNLEARARDARYAVLEDARVEANADVVLVGHTADDQAETILLNIMRGAAATGLSGMPRRNGAVVRPLLDLRRADTHAICAALGLTVVSDPMNDDASFRRVAIRHEVLPMLARVAARDLVPVLARQADILRSESEYLDEQAARVWPGDEGPRASTLANLPMALARRAVRQWLGAPPPSIAEVERVLAVANGDVRATELAGGRTVRRSAGRLAVTFG